MNEPGTPGQGNTPKAAEPRLAIIYLPGIMQLDGKVDDELAAIGRKLANSLDKTATESKSIFSAMTDYVDVRGEKLKVSRLERKDSGTNAPKPIADLYLMDYRPTLMDCYRTGSIWSKCGLTLAALIVTMWKVLPRGIAPHDVKSWRERYQAIIAVLLMLVMVVYFFSLLFAAVKVVKDALPKQDPPPKPPIATGLLRNPGDEPITNGPAPLTNVFILTNTPSWTNLPVWTNWPFSTNWPGGIIIPGTNWALTNWWVERTNDGTMWPWMPFRTNWIILTNIFPQPLGTNTIILTNLPFTTNWPSWSNFPNCTNWPGGMILPPYTNAPGTNFIPWFTNFPSGGTSGPPPILVPGTNWPFTNWPMMTNWGPSMTNWGQPWGGWTIPPPPPPPKKSGWQWFKEKWQDFWDCLLRMLGSVVFTLYEHSIKIFVLLTAIGVLTPNRQQLWQGLTHISEEMVALTNYITFGRRRAEITGTVENFLEKVMEAGNGAYDRYAIVSYSFGSIVALDTFFPTGNVRAARLNKVESLITIGSPHDFVLTFWPHYFKGRNPKQPRPAAWINVYSPIDLFASKFENHAAQDAGKTVTKAQSPTLELSYREGMTDEELGWVNWIFLVGLRVHSMYWSHTEDGERNCFDELMPHLFAKEVGAETGNAPE